MYNDSDISKKVGVDDMARKSRYPERNKLVLQEDSEVRVGVYARLSSADRDDTVSESIKNQISLAYNYLEEHRNFIHIKNYVDDGHTGQNFNRPAFQEMLGDLKAGIINCVVVKDISRLGRNYILVGELMIHEFSQINVRFISINDGYDSIDHEGGLPSLDLMFQTVLDKSVSTSLSKQISMAIASKVHNGDFLPASGSIPYGYMRDAENGTYKVDEETALVVRKIFAMRTGHASISAITAYLNGQEIPSPGKLRYMRGMTTDQRMKETQWTRATVRKILNDISYMGHRVHGRKKMDADGLVKKLTASDLWTIIENTHPAIIPEELFKTVQAVNEEELDKHSKQEKRSAVIDDYREVLRRKVFCADCGRPMIAKKSAAKPGSAMASFIYYECSNYYSDHTQCSNHYVREDAIVAELTKTLNEHTEIVLDPLYRKANIEPYKAELEKIRKEILCIRREQDILSSWLMRSYEQYQEKKASVEAFERTVDCHNEQMRELEERKRELISKMRELDQRADLTEAWIETAKEFRKETDLTRKDVDSLVDKISISAGSKIQVELCFEAEAATTRGKVLKRQ